MTKVFYSGAQSIDETQPIFVDASPPHPERTQYKISIETEALGGMPAPVVKIQMVYDGRVSVRPPSYPLSSDDAYRVMALVAYLITEQGKPQRLETLEMSDCPGR